MIDKITVRIVLYYFLFVFLSALVSPAAASSPLVILSKRVMFDGDKLAYRANYSQPHRPRVGLVLSGGGSRGMFHIGVLKALEKNHIPIDLIVGTSIGSVIGGLYASGYSPDEIWQIMKSIQWKDIYRDETQRTALYMGQKGEQDRYLLPIRFNHGKPYIPESYSPGQKILNLLTDLVLKAQYQAANSFDNLKIPFRAVCTDLVSGRMVALKDGDLAEAMSASSAFPLLFSPVHRDSMLLVDGGLRSNLPVSVARNAGVDVVIAVDVSANLRKLNEISAPWEIVDQATTIMSVLSKRMESQSADILIHPELGALLNSDFSKIDSLVWLGQAQTEKYLPQIRTLLGREEKRAVLSCPVDSVVINGAKTLPVSLYTGLRVYAKRRVTENDLMHDIDRFIAFGKFRSVCVRVDTCSGGQREVHFDLEPWPVLNRIEFIGNKQYPDSELVRIMSSSPGQRLNHSVLQRDLARLIHKYRDDGFSLMRIQKLSWVPEQNRLTIGIDEGVIHDIIVRGNTKTHDLMIKREFLFQRGKVFNWKPVARAIQNTYASQLFKRVGVDFKPLAQGYDLIVKVEEKSTVLLRLGGKYDTERRAQVYMEFGEENLMGRGVRLMLNGRFGNRDLDLGFNLRNDRILTTYLTVNLNMYYRRELNPYTGWDGVTGGYKEERLGVRFQVGQQVRRIGQLVFELRQEHIKDTAWQGNFTRPQDIDLRTFAIRAVTDKRNRIDFPTRGIYNHWAFESGNRLVLETKEVYTKVLVNLEGFYTFRKVGTWHIRAFFGLGDKTMPFSENFRMGGLDSFYGLHQNEYFGRQMIITSAEYRRKLPPFVTPDNFLIKNSYFSVRYDFGGIWENPNLVFTSDDFFSAIGAAFSLETLFGPLHLAYGRTTRGTSVAYLSLGFNY